jgi:MFS family permease
VTGNLAVPGSGSLAAGRAVGYFQMALTFIGFILSLVCGAAFIHWYFANASQFAQLQQDDPGEALGSLWEHAHWAFFGVAVFVFALAWAAITSFQILQAPRKDSAPPRIE